MEEEYKEGTCTRLPYDPNLVLLKFKEGILKQYTPDEEDDEQ